MNDPIIQKDFSLGTDLSALEDLQTALEKLSERADFSQKDHFQIRLVLDELVTNSVSYGFTSGIGTGIDINITIYPDRLCKIVYTDDAPPFDSLANVVPEEKRSTKEAHYGGFGISLIKQMMSDVTYCYEDGKNIIKMSKQLAPL